ncbi:uncharacterized protein LACBIDRAFT_311092 [Laccaria bicolor S238N-H82]|uniref:Predicted protein n=1 Tax=Laccaria bicolor (strain S238N-H82 / ATCC MYA-4686) TaxID=486041 RepID=B0CZ80_LACBS|nr:uncharacterized protein LACBIDRAFT_311092 [Laccaria bicolor S238N-H82]EDR12104.1 predicted protein [Laccaria bicolor S238N-H82]|eukprot:XP_001876368.1 predicted protein [Laccaria bicolor S238N-H82]
MATDSPTLVSDLWYDDGNIVLQAESSLFRVSLGVLAARSPVFDDIRKLPRSQDQEMYDDCPLIVLPDKAEDLANFLRAVYNSGFFQPPPSKTDFDTLAGILRLSTKYEIPYLRQRALLHLDTIICNTLQDHDTRENKRTIPPRNSLAFLIADLAHEMDLPWLLPPVLYFCTEDIVRDYMYKGERKSMNKSQQVACIKALMPLIKWHQREVLSFLYLTNVDGCKSFAQCNEGRLKLSRACSASEVNFSLISFSGLFEEVVRRVVCTTCCIASRDAHLAGREALWEALPGLFDLPSWETLRTLRAQALAGS